MSVVRRSSRIARRTNPDSSAKATSNQFFNELQSVNKMPPELLGQVFLLGEGMERSSRAMSLPYKGFQSLVTSVCRHWRDVAINTPALWEYIYISRPPPYLLAQLYISRSGGCPLIIDIDMETPYISPIHRFDHEGQVLRFQETMELIIGYGGTVDRWREFVLLSKVPQPIFEIIQLLNATPSLSLRLLSLRWKSHSDTFEPQAEDAMTDLLEENEHLDIAYSLPSGPLRPRLQRVELHGLPNQFVFDRPSAMFSNLVTLEFTSLDIQPPSIRGFSTLLSANPRLESLGVDVGFTCNDSGTEDASEDVPIGPLQVQLPFLRRLSLNILVVPKWGLQALRVVDAPGLHSFTFSVHSPPGPIDRSVEAVYRFLGAGRVDGVLQTSVPPEDSAGGGPIFPHLQYLDAVAVDGDASFLPPFLEAFPTVTEAVLGMECLTALLVVDLRPKLLPNLSYLNLVVDSDLCEGLPVIHSVLTSRANGGMRLNKLDINVRELLPWLSASTPEDENYPKYQEYISPILQVVDKFDILQGVVFSETSEAFDTEEISATDEDSNSDDDPDEMDTEED